MLNRGLALLASYRPGESDLSQTELGRRTGLPKPTVHRLVAELVEWGALERTKTGVRLGQWLYLLGVSAPRIGVLRAYGQPFLDRLHEFTREHVCLSVLCGDTVVDIAAAGPLPQIRPLPGGCHRTLSHAARCALVTGEPEPRLFTSRVSLAAGPAVGATHLPRSASDQLASAAVPVSVFGSAVAAVSTVGPAVGFDSRANGAHLQAAAAALARKLALTETFGEQLAMVTPLLNGGERAHTEKRTASEPVCGRENGLVCRFG